MTESTDHTDINQVLARVTEAVVGQFELTRLLQQVVTTSMETLHAEVCSIFLVDRDSNPKVDFDAGLPLVSIDARRLGESVKEVIRNAMKALKAARKGGTIRISTRLDANFVVVAFNDNGPGFPSEFPMSSGYAMLFATTPSSSHNRSIMFRSISGNTPSSSMTGPWIQTDKNS